MTNHILTIEKAVEQYLEWGLAIIPAAHRSKTPLVEWKKYQREPPKRRQVEDWFKTHQPKNIAVICGVASGNLVVLDFDDPEVYSRFFDPEKIEAETPVVRTGRGGLHVYFKTDKPVLSFRIPELKMEVRGTGSIVIVPPSIHPNGKPYEFVNPAVKNIATIKDLEESVWRRAQELGVKLPKPLFEEEATAARGEPYTGPDPPCITRLMEGVEEGFRNEAAMRLAAYHLKFKRGADREKVLRLLERWNKHNRPPLPGGELKEVVKNAAGLERSYGCRHMQPWCSEETCPLMRNHLLRQRGDKEAERILSQSDVLAALKPHLDNILAGEEENKALCFTLLSGGKSRDPAMKQIILLKAEYGAGKTTLMKLADAFHTKTVGRLTAHALDYMDLTGYEVLRLQEIGMMDQEFQGVSTIKFLSPDDMGYTVEATERDPATGRFTTRQYRIPPITLITSTARVEIDPAFERRAWILNPDESEEQTRRVREWKAKREREKGLVALGFMRETSYDYSIAVLRAVAKKLETCEVVLPFPETVAKILKSGRLRARGDIDKLFAVVKLYAFLHQRTLPRARGHGGAKIVFVTPKITFKALQLAAKPYATMTSELEERSRRLISALKDLGVKEAGEIVDLERREKLAVRLSRGERSIRNYLEEWVKAGYMSKRRAGGGNIPVEYKLLYDLGVIEQKSSGILEINGNSINFVSSAQKEAEKWLDGILEKITPADGWCRERILQAFQPSSGPKQPPPPEGFEKAPSVEDVFSNIPSGRFPSPVQPEKPEQLEIPIFSNMPRANSEKKPKTARPASGEEKPSLGGLLSRLRGEWTRGRYAEFDDLLVEKYGYAREEAERLRERWLDEGLLAYDPEG
jgi:hypothetical protein